MTMKRLAVFFLLLLSLFPVWPSLSSGVSHECFLLKYSDNLSVYNSDSLFLEYERPVRNLFKFYSCVGISNAIETASFSRYSTMGNILLCDIQGGLVYGSENLDFILGGGLKPVFFDRSLRLARSFISLNAGIYNTTVNGFYSGLRLFCFFNSNGFGAGVSVCGKFSFGEKK